jgi:hypothetical protein
MNPNNLYYHAIYGNTNEMNYILADIRDSLKPYLDFLTRAIDAEKERKVYAYFEFIEDEKTISLERLTKSYEVIATGEIECTLENDWYEVLNYDDLIRSYNLDFNQIDQLPLFWLNDEGLQQQILIEKNSINFVHFKSKFKEKDSSYEKDCVDDGDDEHHLFIRFEDKLDLDALKDIRYKRAKLELRKQLDSVDHVILTQSGNDIQVIDIKKKTASKLVIKFQGSIDPTIPLEINGYPIQFQILKSLSLTDIQRFTLESGNNERELNTRDIQRNFETGTLLIPKPNRGEILHAYNKNDEEITLSEIRIKKNTIIKYKENNHEGYIK